MDIRDYDEQTQSALKLFVALFRCFHSVSAHVRQDIARYGLSSSEFGVLEMLYHLGPLPQCEVARKILLSTGSLTYVVDNLVEKNLVERIACTKDRRRLYAQLTAAGAEMMKSIFPVHAEFILSTFSSLDQEEQKQLALLLKKLGRSLQPNETPSTHQQHNTEE